MPVPKLLHQIWMQGKDAVPARYTEARATWQDVHPDWTFRVWDEADLMELAKGTRWEAAVSMCRRLIQRADVLRCVVLERFGGVYADMDMYALKTLNSFLSEERIQVGETTFQGIPLISKIMSVNNGIIFCPPNHPFWSKSFLPALLRRLHTNTFLDDVSPAWNTIRTTGPGLWSSFLHNKDVLCHPTRFFYALGIGKQQTTGKLTPSDLQAMEGSFTYHMQDSAWLDSWEWVLIKMFIHKNWMVTLAVVCALCVAAILVRRALSRRGTK
jgi:mannosyltransferase OCH1-like enzyme